MNTSGSVGAANYEIETKPSRQVTVRVWRDYPAGSAEGVWRLVSDFGGIKTIFPTLLSVYLTFPDSTDAIENTVRYMTFAPGNAGQPLSATNPLPIGVEQLMELDAQARRLTYISVLGLPVQNYRSVMQVSGDDDCRLTWTSSFTIEEKNAGFLDVLAHILAGGANQIASVLA